MAHPRHPLALRIRKGDAALWVAKRVTALFLARPGPGVRIRRIGSGELAGFCLRDVLPKVSSSFSDDNRLWATAYDDGMFVVGDIHEAVQRGREALVQNGFNDCMAFAMSHDLKHLAYAKSDGMIRTQSLELPTIK